MEQRRREGTLLSFSSKVEPLEIVRLCMEIRMLPAPKRKAHADTRTHTSVPGLRVRHPVERDINSCANFKREGEREREGGRGESRYDSNRAVGKYFFGRKEPREKKETGGVVFCPWRERETWRMTLLRCIRRFDDVSTIKVSRRVLYRWKEFFFFFWKLWNISFSNLSKEDNKLGEKSMKNK